MSTWIAYFAMLLHFLCSNISALSRNSKRLLHKLEIWNRTLFTTLIPFHWLQLQWPIWINISFFIPIDRLRFTSLDTLDQAIWTSSTRSHTISILKLSQIWPQNLTLTHHNCFGVFYHNVFMFIFNLNVNSEKIIDLASTSI